MVRRRRNIDVIKWNEGLVSLKGKWNYLSSVYNSLPDGIHKNLTDLILIDKRWKSTVRNCRTYQGADISSDHNLVMRKVQI